MLREQAPAAAKPGVSDVWVAAALALALVLVYNSNGREIGSIDSQPNKFAARELLLRRTLALNHVIGAIPLLADRPSFVLDRGGRFRSAYSPVSSVLAAGIAWPLVKTGLLDLRAPLAANVIAVLGASTLTAISVAFAYLTARRRVPRGRALLIAAGLGLGTGFWYAVSQTLWVHETAILGIALAVFAFARPGARLADREALLLGAGLGLAAAARPQLAPIIIIVLAGCVVLWGVRAAVLAGSIVAAAALAMMLCYYRWFGSVFGPLIVISADNNTLHGVRSSFVFDPAGFAGLLVSPNRGLLVFSPVVLVALAGLGAAFAEGRRAPLVWCALAASTQFVLYGTYAVWWAGHTYGPRYLLDVLPLLVPLAAAALARMRVRSLAALAAGAALAWSIAVSATGAFYYPNDVWNADPTDVDRDHARLWSWSDMQIVRCWQRGPSPQNFSLFTRDAFRTPKAGS
ncbi:MAG TPA: hypothetical protein VL225_02430 [Vicinamibacterales bacterium]|jgi:hypothetical protein|nr:hypothetical protein [Vicinamibacterales bacterium]